MLFPAAKKVLIPEQDTILVFDRSSNIKCFSAESLPEHFVGLSEIEIRRLRTFIPDIGTHPLGMTLPRTA